MGRTGIDNATWRRLTGDGRFCYVRYRSLDVRPCSGRIQVHHIIGKQRLKRDHKPQESLSDPRNMIALCARHHHLVHHGANGIRLGADDYPEGLCDFANDYDYELDKDGRWYSRATGD